MRGPKVSTGCGEEQDGVDDRGEDFDAVHAERSLVIRGAPRDPDREQRQADPRDVGELVSCVREQGEAVCDDSTDHLDHEDRQRYPQDEPKAAAMP